MELLIFSLALVLAVAVSELSERTALSSAVLVLVAGFLSGGVFGWIEVGPDRVKTVAQIALLTVLFTDGLSTDTRDLRAHRHAGAVLLGVAMPLTILLLAVLGRVMLHLSWTESFLVGAVLSPTDPVLAAALVSAPALPGRLRQVLNIESGLNDGLALPIVISVLALAGPEPVTAWKLVAEVAGGVLLGLAVPAIVVSFQRARYVAVAPGTAAIGCFSIGLLAVALARVLDANEYLAAFTAGVSTATVAPTIAGSGEEHLQDSSEVAKLAALFVFAALIAPHDLGSFGAAGVAFALLTFFAVRPLAVSIAVFRLGLSKVEWVLLAWFGPRGFSSVVYGLIVLSSGISRAGAMFHLVAIVVGLSVIIHASSDVLAIRWIERRQDR